MMGEEDTEKPQPLLLPPTPPRPKAYLRSVSWTGRSPSSPNPNPNPNPRAPPHNAKARLCLPPLQPLSVARRTAEEWPTAGSDDLGVWTNTQQTPRGKQNGNLPPALPEFQFKRDKLAFYDKECSKIADHVYLGSDAVAKNRETLRLNGITHVLNCVGFVSPEYFKKDLVYKTLWLQDSPSEDITSILYDVFDYFEDVREQGGRVLVHCCQGVSRSTSLVIAYLMWREGRSFEDAFQYVKAARGVTNPNMGFACQLLQRQKRTVGDGGFPSPDSNRAVRIYRIAPHSPYDPLHLVPKQLGRPGPHGLDSRGAFVVHVPKAIYVWVGKKCKPVMSNKAMDAAFQVVRYEKAKGPVVKIGEGEEPSEFWDSLAKEGEYETGPAQNGLVFVVGERKVSDYDSDFEIFDKALTGGVVPAFPVSSTDSETCLPARENGWDRLRQKFANGLMREFVASSKFKEKFDSDSPRESECSDRTLDEPCGSPDSFSYFLKGSPKETGSPIFSSKSPTLSPSTSDYSGSSFTFSPSSSNWSDRPSPSGVEPAGPLLEKDIRIWDKLSLPYNENPNSPKEGFPLNSNKLLIPSIAERRGSNPLPRMFLRPVDEKPQGQRRMIRSWSFSMPELDDDDDVMMDCDQVDGKTDEERASVFPIYADG